MARVDFRNYWKLQYSQLIHGHCNEKAFHDSPPTCDPIKEGQDFMFSDVGLIYALKIRRFFEMAL